MSWSERVSGHAALSPRDVGTPRQVLMDHRAGVGLTAALRAFRAEDVAERKHRNATIALLASPGDPLSRASFEPGHVTASAFVVSPDGASLLLVHHRRLRRWVQPGGHVDAADASVLGAAMREVSEETGVNRLTTVVPGVFDVDVHDIPSGRDEPPHKHFDVRFLLRAGSRELSVDDEVNDARWIDLAGIGAYTGEASIHRPLAKIAELAGSGDVSVRTDQWDTTVPVNP